MGQSLLLISQSSDTRPSLAVKEELVPSHAFRIVATRDKVVQ